MDANQSDAVRSLHRWGFMTRSDVTLPPDEQRRRESSFTLEQFQKQVRGRADLLCSRGGRTVAIEVKNGNDRFPFANLEAEKRQWAETWCRPEPFCTEYWIWLELGTDPVNYNPDKYAPRRTWLVPYPAWLDMEAQIRPYQLSLPYRVGKGYNRELQRLQLDAIHLLVSYELRWKDGKDKWGITALHPFYRMYMALPPLPLFGDHDDRSEGNETRSRAVSAGELQSA